MDRFQDTSSHVPNCCTDFVFSSRRGRLLRSTTCLVQHPQSFSHDVHAPLSFISHFSLDFHVVFFLSSCSMRRLSLALACRECWFILDRVVFCHDLLACFFVVSLSAIGYFIDDPIITIYHPTIIELIVTALFSLYL